MDEVDVWAKVHCELAVVHEVLAVDFVDHASFSCMASSILGSVGVLECMSIVLIVVVLLLVIIIV
jgi:hypothetical protein